MRNIAVAAVALLAAACSHQQRAARLSTNPAGAGAPIVGARCVPIAERQNVAGYDRQAEPPALSARPYLDEERPSAGPSTQRCIPAPGGLAPGSVPSARTPHAIAPSANDQRQNVAGRDQAAAPSSSCSIVRVHFAFDDDRLSPAAKAVLERNAACFTRGPARLTIEGNADERGSSAYNRDLGARRARAVASYLESLGVSSSDMSTISFGKERPLCLGHEESCWRQNRRATLRPNDLASTPRTIE